MTTFACNQDLILEKMSKVKTNLDLIQWLGYDMSIKVFSYLDNPGDLVRASAVSSSWNDFVIENGLCKQLCLKMIPEISAVVRSIEVDNMIESDGDKLGYYYTTKQERLNRNHRVYALLAFGLIPIDDSCISQAICASSTNDHIRESLTNTLDPRDSTEHGPSYWSSIGQRDPSVTETLLYRLFSKICLVTEINVQPFQAKAIRFRLGRERDPMEIDSKFVVLHDEMTFSRHMIWTYTSPVFSMSQENKLQHFKLPEPVLCSGGFLLVELLGSVQKNEDVNLFYICISHVKVGGRILFPEFVTR
ncbi:F-box protein At4g00755-like isoform X2 [Vicia villosa]|uniref:F-box protein At4g00755-like isoform X2 n=1 Tax=Vicia villosa TaxID=3911 RepID=UPI00273B251E|nr:F-box protein At4g00755-like isoform X2 [Vicia villosa]XP_058779239.1 F-box protein At4g00755-like isoform X2 [Vicia villosa]